MSKFLFVIIAFLEIQLLASAFPLQNTACTIAPTPDWVNDIDFQLAPAMQSHQANNTHIMLRDRQVQVDQEVKFSHLVMHLLNPSAVQEHSNIEIEFDPLYETLFLHKLSVHRNQEQMDKIHSARIEVIQKERQIDHYQFNGTKTCVIFLDDIQSGDIIEYSYSKKGFNPVFKGIFSDIFYLQTYAPVKHSYFRFIASPTRTLHVKAHHTSIQPHIRILDDQTQEWTWETSDMDAYQKESSTPSWYIQSPYIQLSEFENWSTVAKWGTELFTLPESYSPEILQLVEQWQNSSPDLETQILHALRFVQNQVRYLGFELGESTHTPTDPNQTLKQRYGDCKDKTLLLKAFLKLLGVESDPVLINTSLKEHITEWSPSALLFDHAILQIHIQDKLIWVDPTYSQQEGNLWHSACVSCKKGLVLRDITVDLEDMPIPIYPPQIVATSTFHLDENQPTSIVDIEIMYKGAEANVIRRYCHQHGTKDLEKYFHNYYAKKYGALETVSALECEDDTESNELTFNTSYKIYNIWKKDDQKNIQSFDLTAKHIYDSLNFDVHPMRTSPLKLEYPLHLVENIFLEKEKSKWTECDYKKTLETDEIAFSFETSHYGYLIHLRYELQVKKDHVPPQHMTEHYQFLQNSEEWIFRSVEIPIRPLSHNQSSSSMISMPFTLKDYLLLTLMTVCYIGMLCLLMKKQKWMRGQYEMV